MYGLLQLRDPQQSLWLSDRFPIALTAVDAGTGAVAQHLGTGAGTTGTDGVPNPAGIPMGHVSRGFD